MNILQQLVIDPEGSFPLWKVSSNNKCGRVYVNLEDGNIIGCLTMFVRFSWNSHRMVWHLFPHQSLQSIPDFGQARIQHSLNSLAKFPRCC